MAATNPTFTSFTITQPFLGAPLQFQPALGSKELEELIDNYIIGSASKQDKLSEVTIDFYNHATVDLNTGSLFRQYDVYPPAWAGHAFEQSPTQSQSSGFSPPIFTPSPGSSATFGDSGYGSISLTPPNRNRGARVSKKPKKDTKKTAEVRLPGFSILTKDGVDVTTSAGRGTKTKEQREHAHLMRIIKACDDCKKKKVRCDPSHRRQHNDMSRTSTSTTKTSSSSRFDQSPTVSVPSLSRDTTHTSQNSMTSFSASNAMDDFVLFPEETAWNPSDIFVPEEADLSNFNFDINDIDLNDFPPINVDQSYDFSSFNPTSSFDFDTTSTYSPATQDQYGLDQWASPIGFSMPVSPSKLRHASLSQDPVLLDPNPLISDSPGSTQSSSSTFADNYWPDGPVDHPQYAQGSLADASSGPSSTPDWGLLDSGLDANISELAEMASSAVSSQLQISRKERCKRKRSSRKQNTNEGVQQLSQALSISSGDSQGALDSSYMQNSLGSSYQSILGSSSILRSFDRGQWRSPQSSGESVDVFCFADTCALIQESINAFKSAPAEYFSLSDELQRLHGVLTQAKSGNLDGTPLVLPEHVLTQLKMMMSQLQVLTSRVKQMLRTGHAAHRRYNRLDPELRPDYLRKCQIQVRRLVRSLCATINNLQAQPPSSGPASTDSNPQALVSGRNVQLLVSTTERQILDGHTLAEPAGVLDLSTHNWQNSHSPSSSGSSLSRDISYGVVLRETDETDAFQFADNVCESSSLSISENGSGTAALLSIRDVPRYHLGIKAAQQSVERLRASLQDQTIQDRRLSTDVQLETGSAETNSFSGFNALPSGRTDMFQATLRILYQEDASIDEQHNAPPGIHVQQVDVRRGLAYPHPDLEPHPSPFDLVLSQGQSERLATASHTASSLVAMSSQHVGSSEDAQLANSAELFRGAIPRTAVDICASPNLMEQQQQQEPFARISNVQNYSLHVVLATMASLAVLMTPYPMQILALLTSLLASWLVLTRQSSFVPSTLVAIAIGAYFVPLLMTFPTPLAQGFTLLQSACSQWIDNSSSPVITLAKLALCCTLASMSPFRLFEKFSQNVNSFESFIALAISSSFLTTSSAADCEGLREERYTKISNRENRDLDITKASSHVALFEPMTVTATIV